jgi:universal stress protein A
MKTERILVPIDLTDGSHATVEAAAALARGTGASLLIVYVEEMLVLTTKVGYPHAIPEGSLFEITQALQRFIPNDRNIRCTHRLLTGPVAETILTFADQEHIDLIVIGTHGRSGIRRMLMGSVAESVLRDAKCPVLVVKHGPDPVSE